MQKISQEDQDFFDHLSADRMEMYRSPPWLESLFVDDVWSCNFGLVGSTIINFNVELEDASLLTSQQNAPLLNVFKLWLCIQTHPDTTSRKKCSLGTSYNSIRRTLYLIDYLLLNSVKFQLSKYGLENISTNDIHVFMHDLASSNETSTSVYKWFEKLTQFLKVGISTHDKRILDLEIEKSPAIRENIPEECECDLKLTPTEIVYARAWLKYAGVYHSKAKEGFRSGPNTKNLSKIIYKNTLIGHAFKPVPNELLLVPMELYYKEFTSAPLRDESDSRLSSREMSRYKKSFQSLALLTSAGLEIPSQIIDAVSNYKSESFFDLKPTRHYKTLPSDVVLSSVRAALEFLLEYGEEITESALRVIKQSKKLKQSLVVFNSKQDISPFLTPKIKALGVKYWSLNLRLNYVERNSFNPESLRPSSQEMFTRLRKNEGLYELMRIMYGAAQVCIGCLSARRQGELKDLISGKCLDASNTRLIFFNRKTGYDSMREKEARPIPPVAVKLIKMLENFQNGLVEIGAYRKHTNLFLYPDLYWAEVTILRSPKYNSSLDIFCDYIETKKNTNGCRYYLRQHQLRRFFAMTFFWGNSFGGMATLRWFLGHTDIEHLYSYITEITPGDVLRSVKTEYAIEQVISKSPNAESLTNLIESRFQTRNFSILDSQELDDYIEELLLDEAIQIEPEFFVTSEGQSYRILIKVSDRRVNANY
ncbi:hypothetical protein [Methylotenera versatilis]|uniref:hypothetical protein n=1 Tax=Methylotenera versatilis TaxID=1055487 RepID=UPI001269E561|nr:hypothetical protein [Methylotenera versatilis]